MGYILAVLGGYLLGCSNMAFYLEKLTKKSVRSNGSGNLGASNAVILLGWKAGILVGAHDIGKALLAVLLARWLFPNAPHADAIAGACCVLGHIFPFYLKFKGGKGFASYVGMTVALDWRIAIVVIAAIILVTLITDYIVAATLSTVISVPISIGIVTRSVIVVLILAAATAVILIKHQENLKRIFITHTEIGFRGASAGKHRI